MDQYESSDYSKISEFSSQNFYWFMVFLSPFPLPINAYMFL